MPNISAVLLYAHDTPQQFTEFQELFVRSNLVLGVKLEHLHLELKNSQRFLKIDFNGKKYRYLLKVANIEKFSVLQMEQINKMAETILKSESLYELKDQPGLEQILALTHQYTFGREYHPTVIDKASYLWHAIATKQLFHNGNK